MFNLKESTIFVTLNIIILLVDLDLPQKGSDQTSSVHPTEDHDSILVHQCKVAEFRSNDAGSLKFSRHTE